MTEAHVDSEDDDGTDSDGTDSTDSTDSAVDTVVEESTTVDTVADEPTAPPRRSLRTALIVGSAVVVALGGLCAAIAAQTYRDHRAADARALMVQAARQAAANLTTVDYTHAEADVQRILDSATGPFYDDFRARSAPFIDVVRKAESKSQGTVTEAGLESVNGDEGRVLVAVSVTTSTGGRLEPQPRYWRMRLTVTKNGDEAKVSKVDFVS
ncbi:MAG: hypothetical protein WCH82_04490 [Mycobacteriaceae bacterium]